MSEPDDLAAARTLAGRLVELTELVRAHAEALAALTGRLDQLTELVGRHSHQLGTLTAPYRDKPAERPPERWLWGQAGPALPPAAPEPLAGWVDWLRQRYLLHDRIPAAWAHVPGIPEELHGLCLAWYAAYRWQDKDPLGPLRWHDALAGVLARLDEWKRALRQPSRQRQLAAQARPDD